MNVDDRYPDPHERSAGGLDYDDPLRERLHGLSSQLASEGPGALLEELEEMVPPAAREAISMFPLTAVALGVGVGIFLGMKKSDLILAAGTSLITAAATQNVNEVLGKFGREQG